jgi:hypothetical protein
VFRVELSEFRNDGFVCGVATGKLTWETHTRTHAHSAGERERQTAKETYRQTDSVNFTAKHHSDLAQA